jgi:hypothetical protein
VESEVHPETLNDIQLSVEDISSSLSTKMIHNAVGNIRKRAELCVKEKGGHFQP